MASSCCTCAASVVTRACAFFMFSMRLPMPPPSLPNRLCTRSDAVLLQAFVDRGQWVPVLLARAVVAGPSEPDHEESRLHISSTAKMRWRALHMGRQGWVRPRRFRAGHQPKALSFKVQIQQQTCHSVLQAIQERSSQIRASQAAPGCDGADWGPAHLDAATMGLEGVRCAHEDVNTRISLLVSGNSTRNGNGGCERREKATDAAQGECD